MQILLERRLGFYDLKIALKTENSFCCLLSFAVFFCCFLFFVFFIEFVTILHLFYVLVFWPQACGILITFTPCSGRQSFNHRITREVTVLQILKLNICPEMYLKSFLWATNKLIFPNCKNMNEFSRRKFNKPK